MLETSSWAYKRIVLIEIQTKKGKKEGRRAKGNGGGPKLGGFGDRLAD